MFFFLKLSAISAQPLDTVKLNAVTENLPPYQIVKDNQLIGGSSYFLVKELLQRAGYQVNFQVLPWARAYYIAEHQANVVIFSMTRSSAREHKFKWIGQLRELTYSFYGVKKDDSIIINSIDDARLLTVVAVRNSFEAQSLIQKGFIVDQNLILVKNYQLAWQMLHKGRADLTYANALVAEQINKSFRIQHTPFFKQPFEVENNALYIAASLKTSDTIVEKLSLVLNDIKNDGTFYQINNP
ncbi:substrate-binding periplasmic protein [Thalassotalea insulae]|uniref:substrate-binding periplasmic protein n=1 Tax=Thalassotalea insulae TaxID=2056778 RepID=UPI0024E0B160|nr:transporter substrate-binding domain-containing protein [Thalassotalea insulae]